MASVTRHLLLFIIMLIITFCFKTNLYANAWVLPKRSFFTIQKFAYFSPIKKKGNTVQDTLYYEPNIEYGATDYTTLGLAPIIQTSIFHNTRHVTTYTLLKSWNFWFRKKMLNALYKDMSFALSLQPFLSIPFHSGFPKGNISRKKTYVKEIKLLGGIGHSKGFAEIAVAQSISSLQREQKGEATLGIKFGYNWITMLQIFNKKVIFHTNHPYHSNKKFYQNDIHFSFVRRMANHKGIHIGYAREIKKKKWNPNHGFIFSLWSGF